MKKILILLSLTIAVLMFLPACAIDLSSEIDSAMEGVNETVDDALKPVFKEDEKYKPGYESDTSTDTETESSSESDTETETETETSSETETEAEKEYTVGTSVGEKLPSYSVSIFDENGLTGEEIDPSRLGKVTVINFWGTWCPPCVNELPEFNEVASEYGDRITMVAIHSLDKYSTLAVPFVKDNYSDSKIIFAKDENIVDPYSSFDDCYETFGGYGYYPHTIVLDENGVIIYTAPGALSKTALVSIIEAAIGE